MEAPHIASSREFEHLLEEAGALCEQRSSEARVPIQRAMQIAVTESNDLKIARVKVMTATFKCLVEAAYDEAIALCEEVLEMEACNDSVRHKVYMNMGSAYKMKGDILSSQESYLKGIRSLEGKAELNHNDKTFLGSFYYNISLLLSQGEVRIQTEDYLLKAIRIFEETEQLSRLCKAYIAYSNIFEEQKDYLRSIEWLLKALEIGQRQNDHYSIAIVKANLGLSYLHINKIEAARIFVTEAHEYFKAHNMTYETGMTYVNMGEVKLRMGNLKEAIDCLYQGERIMTDLDAKSELANIYKELSNCLERDGQFETALKYARKHTEMLKYFFNNEKTIALTRAKKEFESEQNEKEAQLLKRKNEEINHYVRKLEMSNNELMQFAHVASHDMREPLRMVTSYVGLLQKSLNGTATPQQTEFMTFAIDGAKRMDNIISDLLRLAKVDANPQIERVRLQSVLEEVKLNLDAVTKERNAVIIGSDLPEIDADRTQMVQLFQNLIANGIKYNKQNNPVVKVVSEQQGEYVRITVSDNGLGIAPQYRDKVFQIFQRLHSNREIAGTGIGLSICKKIVEGLGGKIWIDDNPGGGTIFNFTLPVRHRELVT